MTEEDIRSMLEDCFNVINIPKERGGPGFNSWEVSFIESVDRQFNRNLGLFNGHGLTDKQLEKLESIWNKI